MTQQTGALAAAAGSLALAACVLILFSFDHPRRSHTTELFDTSAKDNIGLRLFFDTSGQDNEGAMARIDEGVTVDRMSGLVERGDGVIAPLFGSEFPEPHYEQSKRHPVYCDDVEKDGAGAFSIKDAHHLRDRVALDTQALQHNGWESGFPEAKLEDRSISRQHAAGQPADFTIQRLADAGYASGFPNTARRVYDRASHLVGHSLRGMRLQSLLEVHDKRGRTGSQRKLARLAGPSDEN